MNQPLDDRLGYGLRRVADRLFYARIKAKMSYEDVATRQTVSVQTVKRWETRSGAPKDHKRLMALAEIYNISYPWMAYRYGKETDNFLTGLKLEHLQSYWESLEQEQQKKALIQLLKTKVT